MASSSPEINPSVDSAESQPRFSYKDASHEEVLEDLSRCVFSPASLLTLTEILFLSRFILNLPDEELASLERICFQVEQAYVVSVARIVLVLFVCLDIGFMRISFASRTQHSLHYPSRNFLLCSFMHVHFSTSGATTTRMPSIYSCNTRLECLCVAQSCWTILGIRRVLSGKKILVWNSSVA